MSFFEYMNYFLFSAVLFFFSVFIGRTYWPDLKSLHEMISVLLCSYFLALAFSKHSTSFEVKDARVVAIFTLVQNL